MDNRKSQTLSMKNLQHILANQQSWNRSMTTSIVLGSEGFDCYNGKPIRGK